VDIAKERRLEIVSPSEDISKVSYVSYLLTRLRVAKRINETYMIKAIVSRLREIDILREEEAREDVRYKNIRLELAKILGSQES
jgi:hypothetical protein